MHRRSIKRSRCKYNRRVCIETEYIGRGLQTATNLICCEEEDKKTTEQNFFHRCYASLELKCKLKCSEIKGYRFPVKAGLVSENIATSRHGGEN
jgi:hypothetical protein